MKLYSLSGNPNKPCLALTFKGTTILLDCSLDQTSLLHFLPHGAVNNHRFTKLAKWQPHGYKGDKLNDIFKQCQGQVFIDGVPEFSVPELELLDLKNVDVILISNAQNMLALPYVTEYCGFRGRIFATEPTLQIGRMYMEELTCHVTRLPDKRRTSTSQLRHDTILELLPPSLQASLKTSSWRRLYTKHDVESCLSRVKMVGFNEVLDVFGALTVSPTSSGHALGSCNWLLQSAFEKIVYLSASSTLTTHPKPFEQAPLTNADVMILSNLTYVPTHNPDTMIREFCVSTAMTLRQGGNVLVPCYPSGVTFDLFECLSAHMDTCGLSQVPMYVISPQADCSLAFSNIFSEWLSQSKQARVYLAEEPFPHAELQKSGRLKSYASINDGLSQEFRQPCVVFTGHPSLRFGDVVHFLDLWGKSSNNMIIFTEPEFPYLSALEPYQPLAMSVSYCPIDTALNFAQLNKLLKDMQPTSVLTPEAYVTPPPQLARPDLVVEPEVNPITYGRHSVVKLPLKRQYEKLEIDQELAKHVTPTEVRRGVAWASVTGLLTVKDGKRLLQDISQMPGESDPKLKKKAFVWGQADVQQFAKALKKSGIDDVTVDDMGSSGYLVHLPNEDSLIRIEGNDTHIISNEQPVRVKIRDSLLECLGTL